jgi:hypothetical protein
LKRNVPEALDFQSDLGRMIPDRQKREGKSLIRNGCRPAAGRVKVGMKFGIANQVGAYYDAAMQTISLKLPDSLLERLEEESRLRQTNKSAVVRAALERELFPKTTGKSPSCYDLARDLAGSVKGLPKDLAPNPKYMEGFGE